MFVLYLLFVFLHFSLLIVSWIVCSYMYLLKKFHVFSKQYLYLLKTVVCICQSSYIYLSKMAHAFVKVVTYICQSPSMFLSKFTIINPSWGQKKSRNPKRKVIVWSTWNSLRGKSKAAEIVVLNDFQSELSNGGTKWVNQKSLKCTLLNPPILY